MGREFADHCIDCGVVLWPFSARSYAWRDGFQAVVCLPCVLRAFARLRAASARV